MTITFSRLLVALLLLPPTAAIASERIHDYRVEIAVQADGSLEVVERITVHAAGSNIRRGIYRDFPTRYRDRAGNNVVVDLDVHGVERNGQPEPWFTERVANGVRINTGDDSFLPVPERHEFTLRYRTTRQLGFFADHDELYFNAIGTGWMFPIDAGQVEVRLPEAVPVDRLTVEGYSGPQGARGQDFRAEITGPGAARWTLTRPLHPREGLTVVLGFPKGLVTPPSAVERAGWLLQDNRGVLVALAGLILLLVYCVRRWHAVGRDPRKGTVIARYEPPDGHTPAGLRVMEKMGYDARCFSADVLELAVGGHLTIHRDKRLLKDDWQLEKQPAGGSGPGDSAQHALLEKLFPGNAKRLQLKNTNAATVSGAQRVHQTSLVKRYEPALFNRHQGSVGIAFLIAVASVLLAFWLSAGAGVLLIIVVAVLMLIVLGVFALLVRAPTPAGRRLLDEIAGLKLYLGVAERDELKRMEGPGSAPALDAQRYEQLLPYAVALEVEDAWTRKFTLAAGAAAAAAATAGIAWYRGGGVSDLGSLSKAVGSSLSSTIASSSRPPGSSSGGGGGGSSGGGGGGGGGGGR